MARHSESSVRKHGPALADGHARIQKEGVVGTSIAHQCQAASHHHQPASLNMSSAAAWRQYFTCVSSCSSASSALDSFAERCHLSGESMTKVRDVLTRAGPYLSLVYSQVQQVHLHLCPCHAPGSQGGGACQG